MRSTLRSVEATVDADGTVRLLKPLRVNKPAKAVLTVIIEEDGQPNEASLLSEAALARDWNRDEEDQAWAYLQEDK